MSNPEVWSAAGRVRTIFMGTGAIGIPALQLLLSRADCEVAGIVTQPDKPAGRSRSLKPSPIKEMVTDGSVPVFQPKTMRGPEALAALKSWRADLIVVMAYGQILPQDVLSLPRLGCINLHASVLPKFRGASPIQAAIAAGENETGIAAMHMEAGLDTGDVIYVERIPILRRDTAGTLHDRLALTAASVLSATLDQVLAGTASRTPQIDAAASYAGRLTRVDARIDWKLPAIVIERKIRAMNPWPVAWTTIPLESGASRELKIFSAIVCRKERGTPGKILRADSRGVLIASGDGALLLKEIQMDGRRRMAAGDWQLGTPVQIAALAGNTDSNPASDQ